MNCPKCGAQVPAGGSFCRECGASANVQATMSKPAVSGATTNSKTMLIILLLAIIIVVIIAAAFLLMSPGPQRQGQSQLSIPITAENIRAGYSLVCSISKDSKTFEDEEGIGDAGLSAPDQKLIIGVELLMEYPRAKIMIYTDAKELKAEIEKSLGLLDQDQLEYFSNNFRLVERTEQTLIKTADGKSYIYSPEEIGQFWWSIPSGLEEEFNTILSIAVPENIADESNAGFSAKDVCHFVNDIPDGEFNLPAGASVRVYYSGVMDDLKAEGFRPGVLTPF